MKTNRRDYNREWMRRKRAAEYAERKRQFEIAALGTLQGQIDPRAKKYCVRCHRVIDQRNYFKYGNFCPRH